ncbi:Copine-9 [Sparganum proliferum]
MTLPESISRINPNRASDPPSHSPIIFPASNTAGLGPVPTTPAHNPDAPSNINRTTANITDVDSASTCSHCARTFSSRIGLEPVYSYAPGIRRQGMLKTLIVLLLVGHLALSESSTTVPSPGSCTDGLNFLLDYLLDVMTSLLPEPFMVNKSPEGFLTLKDARVFGLKSLRRTCPTELRTATATGAEEVSLHFCVTPTEDISAVGLIKLWSLIWENPFEQASLTLHNLTVKLNLTVQFPTYFDNTTDSIIKLSGVHDIETDGLTLKALDQHNEYSPIAAFGGTISALLQGPLLIFFKNHLAEIIEESLTKVNDKIVHALPETAPDAANDSKHFLLWRMILRPNYLGLIVSSDLHSNGKTEIQMILVRQHLIQLAVYEGIIQPSSGQVEITGQVFENLSDTDVLSKSDPLVVVYELSAASEKWHEIFRTETIQNNLNPDFTKKLMLKYHFEEQRKLKFEVGGPPNNKGSIIFVAEEAVSCNNLDKKDIFGLSDPFLTFYRTFENGSVIPVHRTEVIKNTLNPAWDTMVLPVRLLCNGDLDRTIIIQCLDWNRSGRENLIGETRITITELLGLRSSLPLLLPLIHPKKAKRKKAYVNSGVLQVNTISLEKLYSFIDYVQGGTELSCCIAIDFTASNGCPQVPGTLHYCTREQLSKYAVALHAVGEIISDYDSDNLFPAYGFGARIPPDNLVSHNFPLNGNRENPFCQGIAGVMDAYRYALQTVTLHGPTNFAPIITQVANLAMQTDDGSQYYILLIITDGIICDMPQTKAAVVNASRLPISIIIVGIGSADFSAMEELDGDDVRLTSRGQRAERDIVQFVPFDDFCGYESLLELKRELARAVLAEIPDQLISYMRSKAIKPRTTSRTKGLSPTQDHPPPYPASAPPYPLN